MSKKKEKKDRGGLAASLERRSQTEVQNQWGNGRNRK